MPKPKAKARSVVRRRERRMTASQVSRRFSDVLDRVRWRKERIVVERGGEAVCVISAASSETLFSAHDLALLVKTLPPAGKAWADAVTAGIEEQPAAESSRWR